VKVERHSPSSLNLFCASPAMYVLERVLGKRQPVGAPAHRGTAVEAGISLGLLDPAASIASCCAQARTTYDRLMALSGDPRREKYGEVIPEMVASGLEELRPYGVPTKTQGFIEWKPEGLQAPIVGYFDFEWGQHGILSDLKTTERLPSEIKLGHARQVALYASSDNFDARITYVTPKRKATYRLDNIREHRDCLRNIAIRVEKFLSLSDEPEFFKSIIMPDLESFYWASPQARQAAWEEWGI
jgi:hypothetical protein